MNSGRQRNDAKDISAALAARIEALATQLLGDPTQRTGREWRFGQQGSLAIVVRGDKAGKFYSYEQAQGGDALDLIAHVQRTDIKGALAWARDWLGGSVATAPVDRPTYSATADDDLKQRQQRAARIWNEAVKPAGTLVETYLKGRGLVLPESEDIRFHPECPRGKDERVPAMIALMRDPVTAGARGIHRTYLNADGTKAKRDDSDTAKQMLGGAGVIMVSPSGDVTTGLFLTEGIENAIAAINGGWAPCWAVGSAGNLARFPVLRGIESLSIISDADDAGRRAARECAERWLAASVEVRLIEPREQGQDWNDVIRKGAAA